MISRPFRLKRILLNIASHCQCSQLKIKRIKVKIQLWSIRSLETTLLISGRKSVSTNDKLIFNSLIMLYSLNSPDRNICQKSSLFSISRLLDLYPPWLEFVKIFGLLILMSEFPLEGLFLDRLIIWPGLIFSAVLFNFSNRTSYLVL